MNGLTPLAISLSLSPPFSPPPSLSSLFVSPVLLSSVDWISFGHTQNTTHIVQTKFLTYVKMCIWGVLCHFHKIRVDRNSNKLISNFVGDHKIYNLCTVYAYTSCIVRAFVDVYSYFILPPNRYKCSFKCIICFQLVISMASMPVYCRRSLCLTSGHVYFFLSNLGWCSFWYAYTPVTIGTTLNLWFFFVLGLLE